MQCTLTKAVWEYVSEYWIKTYGRLGRSQGCPALSKEISKEVIGFIKDGTVIFAYVNDEAYLRSSTYLNIDRLLNRFDERQGMTNQGPLTSSVR